MAVLILLDLCYFLSIGVNRDESVTKTLKVNEKMYVYSFSGSSLYLSPGKTGPLMDLLLFTNRVG